MKTRWLCLRWTTTAAAAALALAATNLTAEPVPAGADTPGRPAADAGDDGAITVTLFRIWASRRAKAGTAEKVLEPHARALRESTEKGARYNYFRVQQAPAEERIPLDEETSFELLEPYSLVVKPQKKQDGSTVLEFVLRSPEKETRPRRIGCDKPSAFLTPIKQTTEEGVAEQLVVLIVYETARR